MACPYKVGVLANLLGDFPQDFDGRKHSRPRLLAHHRAQPRREEPHFLPQLLVHNFSGK